MNVELKTSDRLLLIGDSASGKTYMMEKIVKSYKRVVVVSADPKEFTTIPNRVFTIDPETTRTVLSKSYEKGNVFVVIDDTDQFFTRFENDDRIRRLLILGRHR